MSTAPIQQAEPDRYVLIFDALRRTLLERAALPKGAASPERDAAYKANRDRIERDLDWAEGVGFDPAISDADFWHLAATKPFYSGKRAGAIREKVEQAGEHLRDYNALASESWSAGGEGRAAYEADPQAYQNKKDLPRILRGARNIVRRQRNLGGRSLVEIFIPERDRDLSPDSLQRIYKNMNGELEFGFVTTLHVMTDLGLPVVKTDRVLTRVAIRLGLITHRSKGDFDELLPRDMTTKQSMALGMEEEFSFQLQAVLREAAKATGLSMRAIDWLLVKMGMDPDPNAGFVNTICGDKPKCSICHAQPYCRLGATSMKKKK